MNKLFEKVFRESIKGEEIKGWHVSFEGPGMRETNNSYQFIFREKESDQLYMFNCYFERNREGCGEAFFTKIRSDVEHKFCGWCENLIYEDEEGYKEGLHPKCADERNNYDGD